MEAIRKSRRVGMPRWMRDRVIPFSAAITTPFGSWDLKIRVSVVRFRPWPRSLAQHFPPCDHLATFMTRIAHWRGLARRGR
jgi:hypothetical protein